MARSPSFRPLRNDPERSSRLRGKKAELQVQRAYLDGALAGFSGYIAADELYDGPFCVLSIVDNHNFRRLSYRVLDHAPTAKDIAAFFKSFKAELDTRGLKLLGITTDGAPLYPAPIVEVFGPDVPHQLCRFHIIKELNKAILHAVASVRKRLNAALPKLPRGRPSKANCARIARIKRKQQRIADLTDAPISVEIRR
jgi:hypothetical protein